MSSGTESTEAALKIMRLNSLKFKKGKNTKKVKKCEAQPIVQRVEHDRQAVGAHQEAGAEGSTS